MDTLVALQKLMLDKRCTISTAESCTGGGVGKRLTDLAGSSGYVLGGVISYSNEIKAKVLGVPITVLETVGAVSTEVAQAMAEGVKQLMGSDYAISTTGIAGPGGATSTKPVGLVYIGLAGPKETQVYKYIFNGNRESVRAQTIEAAIQHMYQYVVDSVERNNNG